MLTKNTEELRLLMAAKCIDAWNKIPAVLDSGVCFTQVAKNLASDISIYPERVEVSGVLGLLPSDLIVFTNEESEVKIMGTDDTSETFTFVELEMYQKMACVTEGVIREIMEEKELWTSKK